MKTPDPEEMSNAALTERNRELRHENAKLKQRIEALEDHINKCKCLSN